MYLQLRHPGTGRARFAGSLRRGTVTLGAGVVGAGLLLGSGAPVDAAPSSPGSPSTVAPGGGTIASGKHGVSSDRATFGIGPTTLGKNNARGYFSYQMGVGGSYSDHVAVFNYGKTPLNLTVFAADLENGDNGSIAVGLQAQVAKDAGGWVRLTSKVQAIKVAPSTKKGPGRVELPFRVVVPDNAIPGDHGAAIVATLSTLGKNPQGENVKLDQRIATRMYIRVAGPLHPSMVIENLNVKYHGTANPIGRGHATVTYTVHNTGNVRLAASQLVSVSGLFGTKTKRISPANIQLLFPRSAQDVTVEVPDVLPTVWQKATVTVTPLLFQDQRPMPVPTDTKTKAFYAVPSTLLGSATLVVVLLLLGWYLRRRRHRRPTPPESSRHSGPDRDPDSPSDARPRPRPVNVIASQKIGS